MLKGKDMTQITSQLRFQARTVLNKLSKDSKEVCNLGIWCNAQAKF